MTGSVVVMWKNDTASSITVEADGLCVNVDRSAHHRGYLQVIQRSFRGQNDVEVISERQRRGREAPQGNRETKAPQQFVWLFSGLLSYNLTVSLAVFRTVRHYPHVPRQSQWRF